MKNRILSMLLIVALIFSMASVAFAAPIENYTDVEKGAWYYEYVKDVVTEGYYIGYNETTFGPEDHMTRAQMVTVLARLSGVIVDGEGVNNVDAGFEDVAEGAWYAAAVKWAHDTGITTGVTPTEFWPNVDVTREDACTFIIRFLNYVAARDEVTFDHLKNEDLIFQFADESKIRNYSAAAVDECMAYGLVCGDTGDETGTFRPQDAWRRCEGAKMISILADILSKGKAASSSGGYNPPSTPPAGDTVYTATLIYYVDGEVYCTAVAEPQTSTTFTWTVIDEVTYTKDDVEYAILGWDTEEAASTTVLCAGDTYETTPGYHRLYAVLVPMDDYIKLAVQGAIEDAKGYAADYDTDYTTVDNISLDTETNTVNVAITGELYSETVVDVIAMATEYAVGILGDEPLPTKTDLVQIVNDVANSIGVNLEDKTIKEVANQIYDKAYAVGADLFSNFRNYQGGYCINKVSLKHGNKTVASFNVTNADGVVTSGAEANKAAAKELAVAIAKEMYTSLKTQKGSEIVLNASVVVEFGTPCPGYDETAAGYKGYSDTYTIALAATFKSDMYEFDGATNTLYLVITDELQEQYEASVEELMTAALENGTVQAKLTTLVKSMLEESGLLDSLSSLAAKDAVDGAIDLWIAANLKAEAEGDIDTPYEFLWTKEGTIVDNGDGTYSTSTGTVLGDNAALYAVVETVYADVLTNMINEKVTAKMLADALGVTEAEVETALAAWKTANTNKLDANSLYSFLYNGGEIKLEDEVYTPAKVGVNDALYELVETVYSKKLVDVIESIDPSELSGTEIDAIKSLVGDDFNTAFAAWQTANADKTNENSLYSFLFAGKKIVDNGDGTYTPASVGVNDALYTLYASMADAATASAFEQAKNTFGSGWDNAASNLKIIFVKAAVGIELSSDKYASLTENTKNYITTLCMASATDTLLGEDEGDKYINGFTDEYGVWNPGAVAYEPEAFALMDEMLVKGIYNATKDNEYVGLDEADRAALVDEMLVEKLYETTKDNEYVGLDKAGREDLVDQLILEALATTTVKGKTLGEYLNHAWNVKSIERMAGYELGLFISLLDNATFQNVVAEYGNAYVSYLAKAIAKLPENASVTVEGVVISKTALNAVKEAAASGDAKAVCAALADYLAPLSDITLGSLKADPLTITVQYGSRSATVNFGLIIE